MFFATRAGRVVVATLCLAAAACAAVIGIPDVPQPVVTGSDASDDADVVVPPPPDAGPDTACPSLQPPPPPAADDPSNNPDQTFYFALHALDFGTSSDAGTPPFGYDLDHVATCCQNAGESCVSGAGAVHCDGDGGQDNSGGQMLLNIAQVAKTLSQDEINQRLQSGQFTLVFQVQSYNGMPNDAQVAFGVFASEGFDPPPGVDAGPDGAAPKWDGTDSWLLNSNFVYGMAGNDPVPTNFDAHAYVSGGVLVSSLRALPMQLGGSGNNKVVVNLQNGFVTGSIVDAGAGALRLEQGQIAGRWATRDLFSQLSSVYFLGQFMCPTHPAYQQFKTLVCTSADLNADQRIDNTAAPCNALSFGLGYVAVPAHVGRVVAPTPPHDNCDGSAVDECP